MNAVGSLMLAKPIDTVDRGNVHGVLIYRLAILPRLGHTWQLLSDGDGIVTGIQRRLIRAFRQRHGFQQV